MHRNSLRLLLFTRVNFRCIVLVATGLSGCRTPEPASSAPVEAPHAVNEVEADGSFRLSPAARQTLGVRLAELTPSTPSPRGAAYKIPASALVESLDTVSVYRVRDARILRVPVSVITRDSNGASVLTPQLREGDAIAVQGVALLRVTEMQNAGGDEGGHE